MTLILILPVMDALCPAKGVDGRPVGPRSRIVSDYLPLLGVAVAYLIVRRAVLGSITIAESAIAPLDNPLVPITTTPFGERMGATAAQAIMTAFAVVTEYARLLDLAGASLAGLFVRPDSARHQRSGYPVHRGRGAGHGLHRRRGGALAPQPGRSVRAGLPRADVFDREQLRHHDRDNLCRAPDVPAECGRARRGSGGCRVACRERGGSPAHRGRDRRGPDRPRRCPHVGAES